MSRGWWCHNCNINAIPRKKLKIVEEKKLNVKKNPRTSMESAPKGRKQCPEGGPSTVGACASAGIEVGEVHIMKLEKCTDRGWASAQIEVGERTRVRLQI